MSSKIIAATLLNALTITGTVMLVFDKLGQMLEFPIARLIGLPGITLRTAIDDVFGVPQDPVTIQRNLLRCNEVVTAFTERSAVLAPANNTPLVMFWNGLLLTERCQT
jgi:hypothetical protein